MVSTQNFCNNISADDLRFLLGSVDVFNKESANLANWIKELDNETFQEHLSTLSWAHLYEQSYAECIANFFLKAQLTSEAVKIAKSANKIRAVYDFQENIEKCLDAVSGSLSEDMRPDYAVSMMSFGILMMNNSRSLMIYGLYINDLINIAKSNADLKKRDEALFNAIRIDASVVGCPTALSRISKATLFKDSDFFKKLKNAITGKLGELEDRNYQKMRFILQLLHESGGINMSDKELKELFAEQLNLYSDSQFTAQKNLGEFARNFKKKKSTI